MILFRVSLVILAILAGAIVTDLVLMKVLAPPLMAIPLAAGLLAYGTVSWAHKGQGSWKEVGLKTSMLHVLLYFGVIMTGQYGNICWILAMLFAGLYYHFRVENVPD